MSQIERIPEDKGQREKVAGSLSACLVAGGLAFLIACGGVETTAIERAGMTPVGGALSPTFPASLVEPSRPDPSPSPSVLPAGIQKRMLMTGTPQETTLYLVGSGRPGPVVLVLGGVHGDEPGGWRAADELVEVMRPDAGALLVVPRANKGAIIAGERSAPGLGDLNRSYPGDPEGSPMARLAAEVVSLVDEFAVDAVIDLRESWGFYEDRPYSDTAFLGQTVLVYPNGEGERLGRAVVESVNVKIGSPREEMTFLLDFTWRGGALTLHLPPEPASGVDSEISGGGWSSLDIGGHYHDVAVLTVEMGQQQPLERRVALHVHVVEDALVILGMRDGSGDLDEAGNAPS